ncbi:MAG TPA: arylsulfotransferase (ASST) [Planctomycetes bacterium]|nr:arylsulfotransferase (ASST) [Planctomycetota bacterium]HIN80465.1 arylsulfotransferase (ASST) [Planctomycetota bacterium]
MARLLFLIGIFCLLAPNPGYADLGDQTVGWYQRQPASFPGYNFFAPGRDTTTYLVDAFGRVVHSWPSEYNAGNAAYLLAAGEILRAARIPGPLPILAGGAGGRVEKIAWDGTLLWSFEYSSTQVQHHHDVEMLPSGNVLMIAWELKSAAEAIAAGRDPASLPDNELWPDHIIEIEPSGLTGGTIVWEWHAWDHLIQDFDGAQGNFGVVADHPELIDLNYDGGAANADWTHFNGVDYNAELDQILISVPTFAEVWVIDHSTTSAEAAGSTGGNSGRGGDLLYRWGNPRAYDSGTTADQVFFFQHCAEWIPSGSPGAGNIICFNNGVNRPGGNASSADELVPPVDASGNYVITPGNAFGPAALEWTYMAPVPTDFFGRILGGVQRLANGNTLLCDGAHGLFIEVTDGGSEVWRYVNPVGPAGAYVQGQTVPGNPNSGENNVFRVLRYGLDAPQLAGLDLTPTAPIELYPTLGDFDSSSSINSGDFDCFSAVFTGPCASDPCSEPIFESAMGNYGDFDGDGDVDCDDWGQFAGVWNGPPTPVPDFAPCIGEPQFIRGDPNADGTVNLADAITVLGYLFTSQVVGCIVSVDANDDGAADISDAITLLEFLFGGSGGQVPPPFPGCGLDPTPGGSLACETPPVCP